MHFMYTEAHLCLRQLPEFKHDWLYIDRIFTINLRIIQHVCCIINS